MDIKKSGGPPLPHPSPPLTTDKSGATSRLPVTATSIQPNWQSGQILQALVLKATPEQLLLNIQGTQASVARPPALSLSAGDRLLLEVLKNTTPPQLKLHEVQPAATTVINRAMRASLPQQQALPPLLANIEYLSRNPAAVNLLDKTVRSAAQQIYYQLPTPESLRQPAVLKQALKLSGTFLENHLHSNTAQASGQNVQQDTRTSLLRLSTQLQHYIAREAAQSLPTHQTSPGRETSNTRTQPESASTNLQATQRPISANNPGVHSSVSASLTQASSIRAAEQLLQQTEGVLARLQIHQLHQLKGEEVGRPSWSLELPVRTEQGINLFDIRIQHENHPPVFWNDANSRANQQQTSQCWNVRMAFDLEGLGPVQAVISLHDEKISIHFHAEQDQTNALFNNYLDMLGSRLRYSGLEVARIDCRQGQPEPIAETLDAPILDEQA